VGVSAYRVAHNGAWVVSAIHQGYTESITYYGFTKREAISRFREEMKRRRFVK
jgi:hypothetical protein